jgi:hypothetical protein
VNQVSRAMHWTLGRSIADILGVAFTVQAFIVSVRGHGGTVSLLFIHLTFLLTL